MDELEISGKRYISSRRAAKDHGYHSDYIGQLIRGNKVVGQKVGRSWYVDAESLQSYLKGEITAPVASSAIEKEKEEPLLPSAAEVEAKIETPQAEVIENKIETKNSPQENVTSETQIPVRVASFSEKKRGLTYLPDDAPLLPEIKKSQAYSRDFVEESPASPEVYSSRKGRTMLPIISLTILGAATFFLIAGVSYLFNYTSVVEGEETTASVSFGL